MGFALLKPEVESAFCKIMFHGVQPKFALGWDRQNLGSKRENRV